MSAPLRPTDKPSEAEIEQEGEAFMNLMGLTEGGLQGAAAR